MWKLQVAAVLIVVLVAPFMANALLPWWGALLFIAGEALLLVKLAPKLGNFVVSRLGMGLFEIKSKVLRGAQLQVHSCEPTEPIGPPVDAPGDEPELCVRLEGTITPNPKHEGPMHLWDPWDLIVVPYGAKFRLDDDENPHDSIVESIQLVLPDGGLDPEVVKLASGLRGVNPRSRLTWEAEVPAGAEEGVEVTYRYSIYTR